MLTSTLFTKIIGATTLCLLALTQIDAQIIRLTLPSDGGGTDEQEFCIFAETTTPLTFNLFNEGAYPIEIVSVGTSMIPANTLLPSASLGGWQNVVMPGQPYEYTFFYNYAQPDEVGLIIASIDVTFKVLTGVKPQEQTETVTKKLYMCGASQAPIKSRLAEEKVEGVSVSPNPAKETFTVNYNLTETSEVEISLYNSVGQRVSTLLANNSQQEGEYNIESPFPDGLNSGIYYVIIRMNDKINTLKLVKL